MCGFELVGGLCVNPECEQRAKLIADALLAKFGEHALTVAISQLEIAADETIEVWKEVVRVLREQ